MEIRFHCLPESRWKLFRRDGALSEHELVQLGEWTWGSMPFDALHHDAQPGSRQFLNSKTEEVLAQGIEP